jgi:hypothetical protein
MLAEPTSAATRSEARRSLLNIIPPPARFFQDLLTNIVPPMGAAGWILRLVWVFVITVKNVLYAPAKFNRLWAVQRRLHSPVIRSL